MDPAPTRRPKRRHAAAQARKIAASLSASAFVALGVFFAATHVESGTATATATAKKTGVASSSTVASTTAAPSSDDDWAASTNAPPPSSSSTSPSFSGPSSSQFTPGPGPADGNTRGS